MNDDNARNAEVEERSTILKRRFGNQLNAEQMDEVAKGAEASVDLSLATEKVPAGLQRRATVSVPTLQEGGLVMTADPQFLPVRELGNLLRTKQVSPVELAEFFLMINWKAKAQGTMRWSP